MRSISKADYESLATFRKALRTFLHFVERSAREAGITPQQHQALLAIAGSPGRDWASVTEIRDALQIAHHAAVGLVDRCVTAGFASRETDPQDRRVVRVALTPEGQTILERVTEKNLRELRAADTLVAELRRLGDAEPRPDSGENERSPELDLHASED